MFLSRQNHHRDVVDKGNAIDLIFSFQRSPSSTALHISSAASFYVEILLVEVKSCLLFRHMTKWQGTDPLFTPLLCLNIQSTQNVLLASQSRCF